VINSFLLCSSSSFALAVVSIARGHCQSGFFSLSPVS
jgi:hypothetical protein